MTFEDLAREYKETDISVEGLAKKYHISYERLAKKFKEIKTDWFDYEKIKQEKKLRKKQKREKVKQKFISLLARDYKRGLTTKQLAEKYGIAHRTVYKFLKNFKADWFNQEEIGRKRVKENKIAVKARNNSIHYDLFEKTFRSLGYADEEISTIKYAILNQRAKTKNALIEINPAIAEAIVNKTESRFIKELLLPYTKTNHRKETVNL